MYVMGCQTSTFAADVCVYQDVARLVPMESISMTHNIKVLILTYYIRKRAADVILLPICCM